MSSDGSGFGQREAGGLAIVLAALAAVAGARLPDVVAEAQALAAVIERAGPQARNCASVLAGSGEVAAVAAALEAFAGGDGRLPHCAEPAAPAYFPLAAS